MSATASGTQTSTLTVTLTPTLSLTQTATYTPTGSVTDSDTPSCTDTATLSFTQTPSFTASPTITVTWTASASATMTPSPVPEVAISVQIFNSTGEMVYSAPQKLMFNNALTGVHAVNAAFVPGGGATDSFQLAGAGGTFTWNGLNSNGQVLAAGVYTVSFVEAGAISPQAYSVPVTILSSESQCSVSIFNSAGELVQYFPLSTYSAQDLSLSSESFVPGAGKPGLTISWGSEPGDSVQWNGLNTSGVQVASGVYRVELTSQGPGSSTVTLKAFVQVLDAAADLLGGSVVAPNPLVGGRTLYISAPGLQASDSLKIGFYDLAGQLVVQAYGEGPSQELAVPNDVSGGVYLLVLEARSAETGAFERKVCKVALVR